MQCFYKKNNYKINEINPILCPMKNIIVNEIVISNNSNIIELTLQTKAELEEINNLNEILNLEV